MDEHETPINRDEARPGRLRAGGSRLLRGAEERVIWPVEDAGRSAFDVVRRPFEWLLWVLQRGLIWPLQDRFDGLGRPARAAVAVASVAAVAAVVAIGIGALASGSGGDEPEPASELVAEPAEPIAAAPVTTPAPAPEPTLEGAAPVFKSEQGKKQDGQGDGNGAGDGPVSSADKQAEAAASSASGSAATDTIASSPAAESATASSSAEDGGSSRPAGKRALAVAREFADAFVIYETGGEKSEVAKAFRASATEELARSLLRRPPRLPADVDVPQARVVNVVAGPSQDGTYPVSVSLLRVGLTSELRLEMELLPGRDWRVTNVLG